MATALLVYQFSTVDLFTDPSWANLGFWAWDIGATFLPYIPGSYTAKGVKMLGKADDAIDAVKALNRVDNLTDAAKVFVDNHRSIVGSYKDIKKTVKALGLKGFEVHHLIEKRFVHALGIDSADEILAVALDNDTHKKITREIRDIIGYKFDLGKEAVTGTASVDQIWSALVTVYENNEMESYLPLIKQYLIDNAKHIGEISNWKGY